MKRRYILCLSLFMALCCLLCALPVSAAVAQEDYSFASLEYTYDPVSEGGEVEKKHLTIGATLTRAASIAFDVNAVTLYLNGEAVAQSPLRLEKAGFYTLAVVNNATNKRFEYTDLTVLPVINVQEGQVFTSYPTIECTNARRMRLDEGKAGWVENLASGTTIRGFGVHELTVFGENGASWTYNFYIRFCHSERVFDATKAKYALKLTVGQFDDVETAVRLDGATEPLPVGETMVYGLGQHQVVATENGVTVTNLNALPSLAQLRLQIELLLPKTVSKEPFFLALSRYDAQFYLDGKPVKGDCRIDADGTHTLTAKNAKGEPIEGAFKIFTSEKDLGTSYNELTLTFDNPNHTYVLFLILPAVLLLAVAAWFFVRRRNIV